MEVTISKAGYFLEKNRLVELIIILSLPAFFWLSDILSNLEIVKATKLSYIRFFISIAPVLFGVYLLSLFSYMVGFFSSNKQVIAYLICDKLVLNLDVKYEANVKEIKSVEYINKSLFGFIYWPTRKHLIRIVTTKGEQVLETNFSYRPLRGFLYQVHKQIQEK